MYTCDTLSFDKKFKETANTKYSQKFCIHFPLIKKYKIFNETVVTHTQIKLVVFNPNNL